MKVGNGPARTVRKAAVFGKASVNTTALSRKRPSLGGVQVAENMPAEFVWPLTLLEPNVPSNVPGALNLTSAPVMGPPGVERTSTVITVEPPEGTGSWAEVIFMVNAPGIVGAGKEVGKGTGVGSPISGAASLPDKMIVFLTIHPIRHLHWP